MSTVVEYTGAMPTKVRDGEATRSTILVTARSQFGNHGFERTTIRSVASEAGVDPALVMHYFGSKAELFAAASRFDITSPISRTSHPTPLPTRCCRRSSRCGGRTDHCCPYCARPQPTGLPRMPCSRCSSTRWPRPWLPWFPTVPPSEPRWSARNCSASRWRYRFLLCIPSSSAWTTHNSSNGCGRYSLTIWRTRAFVNRKRFWIVLLVGPEVLATDKDDRRS